MASEPAPPPAAAPASSGAALVIRLKGVKKRFDTKVILDGLEAAGFSRVERYVENGIFSEYTAIA